MAYQAFRENGFPTYYAENKTPWMADYIEAGLIYAFLILAVSFYAILPGIRGKEKLFTFLRVTLSLYVGSVIIITNWSYTWETSSVHTRTKYKAGTGEEITANIGVNIGLRGINITLKGDPVKQLNETINYNEHFSWEWEQGRLGFGPQAGPFNREYRAAQFRGLPLPVLWIAEYFTLDGEGIRWGRHYRQAGWFSHILLWLCFPLWVLTNILFFVLLRYGAYFMILTGTCMVTANIIFATLRNSIPLEIPWEEGKMEFSYGGSFYICLITGILCIIVGIVIRILDLRFPNELTSFFGVDVLQDADDFDVVEEDDNVNFRKNANGMEMGAIEEEKPSTSGAESSSPAKPMRVPAKPVPVATPEEPDEEEELYTVPTVPESQPNRYAKRKSRFQKSRRRRPPPPPPTEDGMYANTAFNTARPDEVAVNVPY